MGQSISNDMRRRIVRGVKGGKTRRAVAAQFEVAPSTAVRVFARFEDTGSVEPARQGREPGSGKLGPHKGFIIDRVKQQPDITMPELSRILETTRGVKVDPSNISKLLCAAGFTYKKNPSGVGTRTQRRQARAS